MLKKLPYLLTVLSIFGGVSIAILFGINEEIFKGKIQSGLEKNQKIQSIENPEEKKAKLTSEADKNWRYYQRFHFHATGIGAMMMGLILLLGRIEAPRKLKVAASHMITIGGFLYPFVWLFSGIYGPEMGRTEAKEAFAVFGYMGGVFLLGTILTLYLVARYEIRES